MKKVVICTMKDRTLGEPILRQLQARGYANEDISILFPNDMASTHAHTTGETSAPELAIAGAVLGLTFGFFIGLGAIAWRIPALAPFLAAGTAIVCLVGAIAGGTFGAAAGTLLGLGLPEKRTERFSDHFHGGKLLISVHTDVEDLRAEKMFADAGAEDVYSTLGNDGSSSRTPVPA